MKKNSFWRTWTILSISLALVVVNTLLVSSLSSQTFPSIEVNTSQSTLSASNHAQQTGMIPVTGGDGPGWSVWVFSGTGLLYCLLLLLPQPRDVKPPS